VRAGGVGGEGAASAQGVQSFYLFHSTTNRARARVLFGDYKLQSNSSMCELMPSVLSPVPPIARPPRPPSQVSSRRSAPPRPPPRQRRRARSATSSSSSTMSPPRARSRAAARNRRAPSVRGSPSDGEGGAAALRSTALCAPLCALRRTGLREPRLPLSGSMPAATWNTLVTTTCCLPPSSCSGFIE
jgi:hypothetical protein